MKFICFAQLRNELENGNLELWLQQQTSLCDKIYVYDQNSTDGSKDLYKKYKNLEVIYSDKNDFGNEIVCKHQLLQLLQKNEGYDNIIFWIDGDTFIDTTFDRQNIENIFAQTELTHLRLRHYNLWRSDTFYRTDGKYHNLYRNGVVALWKNSPDLSFNPRSGLHTQVAPDRLNSQNNHGLIETSLIHRGFATDFQIIKRYKTYKSFGQTGYRLEMLLDEQNLSVTQLDINLVPTFIPKNLDSPIGKELILEKYRRGCLE